MNHGRPMTLKEAYTILDVTEQHGLDSIKQSYRRTVRLYHPDVQTGLSDPEKFSRIVTAYNLITEARKAKKHSRGGSQPGARQKKSAQREGFTERLFNHVGSFFHRFGTPAQTPHTQSSHKSRRSHHRYTPQAGAISFEEMVTRFDRSHDVWIQIESAHAIFDRYRSRFEVFALLRLRRCKSAVLAELITLLGRLGQPSALRAVAPFITSRDRQVLLAAFVALDGAGDQGYAIIDYYLSPPSAFMYGLTRFFRGADFEKRVLRQKLIPPHKLRRISAIRRHTGVPLKDLLEGIGVVVSGSA